MSCLLPRPVSITQSCSCTSVVVLWSSNSWNRVFSSPNNFRTHFITIPQKHQHQLVGASSSDVPTHSLLHSKPPTSAGKGPVFKGQSFSSAGSPLQAPKSSLFQHLHFVPPVLRMAAASCSCYTCDNLLFSLCPLSYLTNNSLFLGNNSFDLILFVKKKRYGFFLLND